MLGDQSLVLEAGHRKGAKSHRVNEHTYPRPREEGFEGTRRRKEEEKKEEEKDKERKGKKAHDTMRKETICLTM